MVHGLVSVHVYINTSYCINHVIVNEMR